jgi:small redox-active disulfide protein 2
MKECEKMKIEILGSGCAKCKSLEKNVRQAVSELGIKAEIVKIEDIAKIVEYGVMGTPAMVVDGVIRSSGKLLDVAAVKKLLGAKN